MCDSRGGLKEPQGKQISEILEKTMVFIFVLKYGSEIHVKTLVVIVCFIRKTLEDLLLLCVCVAFSRAQSEKRKLWNGV